MADKKIQAGNAERYKEIPVKDIIAPLFRRKRLILTVFLAVTTLLIILAAIAGPTYSSQVEILVNRQRQDPLVSPEAQTQLIADATPVTETEINSEVELLGSRDVLEKVVLANNLSKKPDFDLFAWFHPNRTDKDRLAKATEKLAKKLKILPVAKTNLIDVTYSSPSPELSYSVLKSLSDAYLEKHITVNRPTGSSDFFAKQTDIYHDQLVDSEAKLRNFGNQSGVAAPDIQRTNLALTVATAIGALHTAEQIGAADEQRMVNDRKQMQSIPERSVTQRTNAQAAILLSNLNAALLAAQTKRAELAIKYDANYPLVKEADEEVALAKSAIADAEKAEYATDTTDRDPTYELLREDLSRAETDLAAQRATAASTRQSIASMQKQMVVLDQQALTQQDLMRDERTDESNYLLYLSKREQERASDALDLKRIGNVAIAVPPAIPVLPVLSWPLTVLITFVMGGFIGVVTGYAVDYFDPSFHTPGQVVDMLGIPIVVGVPKRTA